MSGKIPIKLLYSRITIALRPVRRRAQVIPAHRSLQINLQHRFYIKGLNTNNRVQKHSGSLKTEFEYNTITTTTIQGEIHILPTDALPTCPIFTGKTGPTRRSTQEEAAAQSRTRRPPRSQRGHNLLKRVTTTTLSILILSKAYPTLDILSPLPRHARLFGLLSSFAKRLLEVNPYFQYFS